MIFDREPNTWEELEEMVNQAFQEMGYESNRNQELSTARGKVIMDVQAIKKSNAIPTHILCECKYWNKPIDQNVIYSFRSICSDIGAHYGLIISRKGFQSGAKESREYTNIHLLNFLEFQEKYFQEWRSGIFMQFAQMFDRLLPIAPGNPNIVHNPELLIKIHPVNVSIKYSMFFGFNRYTDHFIKRKKFPIKIIDPRGDPTKLTKIKINTHREYYDIGKKAFDDACNYFEL